MLLHLLHQIKKIILFLLFTILFIGGLSAEAQHISKIIFEDGNGQLNYISDIDGNRIPDYSHAGYNGGVGDIPNVPAVIELNPVNGDNSKQIQDALNNIASMAPDDNGIRGAVLLAPGVYNIFNNLYIRESGIVLRGGGDGDDPINDTILKVSKSVKGTVLQIGDENVNWFKPDSEVVQIVSDYINVGSRTFKVEDATIFNVGDNVILRHRSSEEWLDAVNGGGTAGAEPWQPGFIDIFYNRYIEEKEGNIIQIDAPVYNNLDHSLTETIVYKPNRKHLVTKSGVEGFRIDIETNGENSESHAENGVIFRGVEDGWAQDVTVLHFKVTGIGTHTSSRITIRNSKALEPHSEITGTRRYNFNTQFFSNNILFTNVLSSNGRRDFVSNGTSVVSGIVFHESVSVGALGASEGHQKWTQAMLYDNIKFEDPLFFNVLGLYNRGNLGASHGWGAVHSTAWNVQAENNYIYVQKPPTAQNYAIANQSNVLGDGLFEHPPGFIEGTGKEPEFPSLYLKQLEDRLLNGTPPDMPNQFRVSNSERNKIVLRWDFLSTKPSSVILERSSENGSFERIATFGRDDSLFVDDSVLEKTYKYRIYSENNGRRSAIAVSDSITPVFSDDILSDFELTTPINNNLLDVRGDPDQIFLVDWTEAESRLDVTYSVSVQFKENKFLAPFFERDSLLQTELKLTYAQLDSILNHFEFDVGENVDLVIQVKGASETIEKTSLNAVDVKMTRGFLGTLDSFSLLSPGETQLIKVQGSNDEELIFSWQEAESDLDVSYELMIDLNGKDFSEPIFKKESIKKLHYTFTFEQLDSLLQKEGISKGSEIEIEWKVKASTRAAEEYSVNTMKVRLQRGDLYSVPDFSLIEPIKNKELNITGLSTDSIEFTWEDAVDTNEFSYSWYLDYIEEDFTNPLIKIDSITQNKLSITFSEMDSLISDAGFNSSDILRAKWTVRIDKEIPVKWSLNQNSIFIERGVIVEVSNFDLISPIQDHSFNLVGDKNQTVQFSWQAATSNRNLSYTLLFDEIEGDFSSPLLEIPSFEKNNIEVSYEKFENILYQKAVKIDELYSLKWIVVAETDYANKFSNQSYNLSIKRGLLFDGLASLDQNYPNPFNIATNIRYHLSADSDVELQIYNSRGALVARFDEGQKNKGTHTVHFNAASLSSGLYFVRLLVNDDINVEKMTLIK